MTERKPRRWRSRITVRRFKVGDTFEVGGVQHRVAQGRKAKRDLRLEQRVDGTWVPVLMRQGALYAEFFYENEDVLYPPPNDGGMYYAAYLKRAVTHGFDKADALLRVERRAVQLGLEDAKP